jgi:peptide/nickel transport system permease protein
MMSWDRAKLVIPAGFVLVCLVAAIFAPLVAPHSPTDVDVAHALSTPSWSHPFGTDQFGRDILSRIIYGGRSTLQIALVGTSIACILGVTLGVVGAYFAGLVELVTLRFTDVILAFPPIVFALVAVAVAGPGIGTLTLVIGFLLAPGFARIAYSQVVSVKRLPFVDASRALGAGHLRIMVDAILRNIGAALIVQFSLTAAAGVLIEAGLSFIGLGVMPPTPSWGSMIQDARQYMESDPLNLFWPCLVLAATILALNTLGDALRDLFDPRVERQLRPAMSGRVPASPADPASAAADAELMTVTGERQT